MTERATPDRRAARPVDPASTSWQLHARHLCLLFVLFGSLFSACWVISHADSLTYDSVVFIRYARELSEANWWISHEGPADNLQQWLSQRSPLMGVIQRNSQHPGFAILIASVHSPLSQVYVNDDVLAWTRSAQIVSLLGLAVMILAVYRLGCDLLDPTAGLVGAALVGFSPPVIRIGADALSDGPAVALLLLSGIFYAQALRTHRLRPLLMGSLFAGTGYLIRPEAIQLALGMGAVLLLISLKEMRILSLRWVFQLSALVVPLLLLVFPYTVVKGSALTKKSFLFSKSAAIVPGPAPAKAIAPPLPPSNHPVPAAAPVRTLKVVETEPISTPPRADSNLKTARVIPAAKIAEKRSLKSLLSAYGVGLVNFAKLWSSLAGYVFVLPLLLAPLSGSIRIFSRPDHLLISGAGIANFMGLPFVLFAWCGYLDIRHIMPSFCLTTVWAWAGCLFLCHALRDGLSACRRLMQGRDISWPCSAEFATLCCMVPLIITLGVAGAQQSLNRPIAGLKSMGERLHKEVSDHTDVVDPSFVSSFYAGLEKGNRWPYVGNFSVDGLHSTLEKSGAIQYVILSDRLIAESTGQRSVPLTLGRWRLREWLAMPLSRDPSCEEMIRTYRVENTESARLPSSSTELRK